jgi:putative hemolysin
MMAIIIALIGIGSYLVLAGNKSSNNENNLGIANPASVYCEEHNGKLEIQNDASGGQSGICIFSDTSYCEEWAYFRGNCSRGENFPECESDSDCVPVSCCHAKTCVSVSKSPICKGVMCTMNCEPGTLDCGGKCICRDNKCSVSLP